MVSTRFSPQFVQRTFLDLNKGGIAISAWGLWLPRNPAIRIGQGVKHRDGIPCLWIPAPYAATVMVYFHGNAEDLGMCYEMSKHLRNQFKVNVSDQISDH